MFTLFVEGGVPWMTFMTLILIALFLAAWKAPAWVKEIGKFAAAFGVFATLVGIMQAALDIEAAGGISQVIVWAGLRVAVITAVYGLVIYMISLIIRMIQKPRI
ncbi:MAG: MotA/TolQ/ExbB proton channel family protein [Bacteroidales bacterium]|jgi:hypothetical protein|nr:MotA/TolQ/ExbB proton channel family protein [Bacteroidales bacterium]